MISTPWLIVPQPKLQAKLRLFCFHSAGSGASLFRPWANYIHPNIELCILRLPGRESRIRESPFMQLSPLVNKIAEVISPELETRPFAFFGHSLGALIGFALTRQLRYQKLPEPVHLFVSSRKPPHLAIENPLHQAPDSVLVEKLREFGGTPEMVLENFDLIQLILPIFRADLTVNETYIYCNEPSLSCPITAFGGTEDNSVDLEQLSQWSQHTSEGFQLLMFPGSHMFFCQQPQPLIATISQQLECIIRD